MQCAQKASAARPVAARQPLRVVPRLAVRPARAAVAEAPSAAAQQSGTKVSNFFAPSPIYARARRLRPRRGPGQCARARQFQMWDARMRMRRLSGALGPRARRQPRARIGRLCLRGGGGACAGDARATARDGAGAA